MKVTKKSKGTVEKNEKYWNIATVVSITLVWSFIYTNIVRFTIGVNPRTLGVVILAFPLMLFFYLVIYQFIKHSRWPMIVSALITPLAYNIMQSLMFGDQVMSIADYLTVAIWDVLSMGVAVVLGFILISYIKKNWPKRLYIK